MLNRNCFIFKTIGLFFMFFTISVIAGSPQMRVQDDTVKAPNVASLPIIDGQGSDDCWGDVEWQEMDQVWIPWGVPCRRMIIPESIN
jgi:hypothetical protein